MSTAKKQRTPSHNSSQFVENKENINFQSIKETISALREYEKLCIDKQDFMMAE